MQLISLNIWGGHIYEQLLGFIKKYSEVDIFCFQEVYHNAPYKISTEDRSVSLNIFSEIQDLLPEHMGYFRPVVEDIYGIGTFVKKDIDVLSEGEVTVHTNPNYSGRGPAHSRNLQWIECCVNKKNYSILNMHGLWNGMGKTDSPERISQSKRVKSFMDSIITPKVLCGDFNLKPDTESMSIIEKDMINLIKTHKVSSTRTSFYPKEEKFADYILISDDINPIKFAVLDEVVSDHSPLFLEFV